MIVINAQDDLANNVHKLLYFADNVLRKESSLMQPVRELISSIESRTPRPDLMHLTVESRGLKSLKIEVISNITLDLFAQLLRQHLVSCVSL